MIRMYLSNIRVSANHPSSSNKWLVTYGDGDTQGVNMIIAGADSEPEAQRMAELLDVMLRSLVMLTGAERPGEISCGGKVSDPIP